MDTTNQNTGLLKQILGDAPNIPISFDNTGLIKLCMALLIVGIVLILVSKLVK